MVDVNVTSETTSTLIDKALDAHMAVRAVIPTTDVINQQIATYDLDSQFYSSKKSKVLQAIHSTPDAVMRRVAELYSIYATIADVENDFSIRQADKIFSECEDTAELIKDAITHLGRLYGDNKMALSSAKRVYKLALETVEVCSESWGAVADRGVYVPFSLGEP